MAVTGIERRSFQPAPAPKMEPEPSVASAEPRAAPAAPVTSPPDPPASTHGNPKGGSAKAPVRTLKTAPPAAPAESPATPSPAESPAADAPALLGTGQQGLRCDAAGDRLVLGREGLSVYFKAVKTKKLTM